VNIEKFQQDIQQHRLPDQDLEDDNCFKVVYLGSIRLVNNIKQLIDAAYILKTHSHIKFLIYGNGSDRDYLEQYCKDKKIDNVLFKEKWIPFQNVPYVLSRSSLNILNYQKDFGIYGVSSGKLFQYLASGKPILCNVKISYCEIEKHNLGIAKNFETPREYANAILELYNLNIDNYNAMCKRVKEIANKYDYKELSSKLLSVLNS
jgi:glycosyltransferase involved in cell wall biosynthesis